MAGKVKTLSFRVSPSTFKELKRLAYEEQTNISAMVRRLIWKKLGVKDE